MTNEMTAEEAIKWLKDIERSFSEAYFGEWRKALRMAIQALEAQPSEDCISRQAVLDAINFEDEWLFDAKSHNADTKIAFSAIKSKISELPSVTPRRDLAETSQDCVSREAVDKLSRDLVHVTRDKADFLCNFWEGLNALPPVIPQRKMGKWIFKAFDEETGISDSYWCSECNRPLASAYKDFCASCGSYNAETKENEDD